MVQHSSLKNYRRYMVYVNKINNTHTSCFNKILAVSYKFLVSVFSASFLEGSDFGSFKKHMHNKLIIFWSSGKQDVLHFYQHELYFSHDPTTIRKWLNYLGGKGNHFRPCTFYTSSRIEIRKTDKLFFSFLNMTLNYSRTSSLHGT